MTTRAAFVAAARAYRGTPFQHLGRSAAGLDCAGLIIAALRDAGLVAADFDVPPYTPTPDGVQMRALCAEHLDAVDYAAMQPGDALLLITDRYPQHLGVLGDYAHGGLSLIHAANNAHPPRVIETRLLFHRGCRFVAAYAVRGLT